MSHVYSRHRMPPGLLPQIVFATILSVGAVAVFPTGLSANPDTLMAQHKCAPSKSAGTAATTTQEFVTAQFDANAFADWEAPPSGTADPQP
jgi:hypothetical protein